MTTSTEQFFSAWSMTNGTAHTGQYFIDHDGDKITRMIGFVGTGASE